MDDKIKIDPDPKGARVPFVFRVTSRRMGKRRSHFTDDEKAWLQAYAAIVKGSNEELILDHPKKSENLEQNDH